MNARLLVAVVMGVAVAWLAFLLLWTRDAWLTHLVRVVPDILRLCRDGLDDPLAHTGRRRANLALLVQHVYPIDRIAVLGPFCDRVVAVLVLRYVRRRIGLHERARWGESRAHLALHRSGMG